MDDTALHERSETILGRFTAAEKEALIADPQAVRAIEALASFSPTLTQTLSTRIDLARWLFIDGSFLEPAILPDFSSEIEASAGGAENLAELQAALRSFRLKELSRLAVRDLCGLADLHEVMRTLSALAEACLGQALKWAMAFTAAKHGAAVGDLGIAPVVLGMGKLGARELNYSSDIDLIYLYKSKPAEPDRPHPQEIAGAVFTLVTRAISELTGDGLVFRVDLDLRPGGKDGAQAQSLDTALKHYLTLGRAWERLALLKARPVAGDVEAGREFLNELIPFVLRRHLDYTSLEELRDLKDRFAREARAGLRRAGAGRTPPINIKLSPGGIRQIEFFAQALIITFGGRLPHLRRRATLEALESLSREGLISAEDRDDLTRAYVFLRTVEHRLQLRELTQTQTLPRSEDGLRQLALAMGFVEDSVAGFKRDLGGHMDQVKKRYGALLSEPGEPEQAAAPEGGRLWAAELLEVLADDEAALDILAANGFRRPEAALAALRSIREEKFLPGRLARYGRNLERLLPGMISNAALTPDPDRAMLHLERFLGGIGTKAGFFVLLEENPRVVELLMTLFGNSDHLSGILIKHPAILDSLIDRRSAFPVKDKARMAEELGVMLGFEDDPESLLAVIRRFKNDEILRIGLYDFLNQIGWNEIEAQLTDLAETVMERTMDVAARQVLPRLWESGRRPPLAVMGQGKLGGRELAYGSDLDLIFILAEDGDSPEVSTVDAVRLAQRFISYLSLYMDAGPGYEIDSRLRPSGGSGPLVVTPSSFQKYHRTSRLWERQALLKMRWILGPRELGDRMATLAEEAVFGHELPEDAAAEIDGLRRKMTRERAKIKAGTLNLKFSPGGLVDGEFLTQYLQLVHGRHNLGRVRSPNTREALGALVEAGLGPAGLDEAGRAYGFLSRASSRLSLTYDRSGDRAAYTREEIARAGLPNAGDDPATAVEEALAAAARVYDSVFGRGR